jgi:hypothetical protein
MEPLPPASQAALDRVTEISCLLRWLRQQEEALAAERDAAIVALVAAGLSYAQVREVSGMSRARVGQIVAEARD